MLAFNTAIGLDRGPVNQEISEHKSSPLRDNAGPAHNGRAGSAQKHLRIFRADAGPQVNFRARISMFLHIV